MIVDIGNSEKYQEQFIIQYEKNYSRILNYTISKVRNKSDAEDIVSESFFSCYKKYSEFDSTKSSFTTWLYVVVNNRIKNYYRDKKDSVPFDEIFDTLSLSNEDEMETAVYISELRENLYNTLKELPEIYRRVIILKYFQNLDSGVIAEKLGMTPVNVRVTLKRALQKAKTLMK